ncbi:Nitrogen assimilation transcription factor nit-4 [Purpureocillium lavendulum]|uniref:Nitrogen assimilation transcription factor nit-4 n=1 Tax=Purpureocillium lavendulum TaxID=1247861 RepID=A0AB34FCP5_9HYPO|nr:Nitrogen assimilation transcription factor nit-4 [Purpureocillium lavendulum]
MAKLDLSTTIAAHFDTCLHNAGFINLHFKVFKVPIAVWTKDKTLRLIGLYQKRAAKDFISVFAGRPLRPLDLTQPAYSAPSSVFICGSQGSGKSYTLSCMLENFLAASEANTLPRPLTGVVFHYDSFTSDTSGTPCEAAYLSSHQRIKRVYGKIPNVNVEELRFDEADLNTKRMLDMMAAGSVQGGTMPLYLHVVTRILRELRITQQQHHSSFNYLAFKEALEAEDLTAGQRCPLQQRLDTLESFLVNEQVSQVQASSNKKKSAASIKRGTNWAPVAGQLTIVDLSCPCVTAEAACALFNICLSLFLEQPSTIGRVVALDEAHNRDFYQSLKRSLRQPHHLEEDDFIITFPLQKLKLNIYSLFNSDRGQRIILSDPKLLVYDEGEKYPTLSAFVSTFGEPYEPDFPVAEEPIVEWEPEIGGGYDVEVVAGNIERRVEIRLE